MKTAVDITFAIYCSSCARRDRVTRYFSELGRYGLGCGFCGSHFGIIEIVPKYVKCSSLDPNIRIDGVKWH